MSDEMCSVQAPLLSATNSSTNFKVTLTVNISWSSESWKWSVQFLDWDSIRPPHFRVHALLKIPCIFFVGGSVPQIAPWKDLRPRNRQRNTVLKRNSSRRATTNFVGFYVKTISLLWWEYYCSCCCECGNRSSRESPPRATFVCRSAYMFLDRLPWSRKWVLYVSHVISEPLASIIQLQTKCWSVEVIKDFTGMKNWCIFDDFLEGSRVHSHLSKSSKDSISDAFVINFSTWIVLTHIGLLLHVSYSFYSIKLPNLSADEQCFSEWMCEHIGKQSLRRLVFSSHKWKWKMR